jgi:hypothetical protein
MEELAGGLSPIADTLHPVSTPKLAQFQVSPRTFMMKFGFHL